MSTYYMKEPLSLCTPLFYQTPSQYLTPSLSLGLNSSLSTSMGEELMHYNKSQIDWVDLQEQLHRDLDSNASSKSTQGNLVNKILTNTNYAPEK